MTPAPATPQTEAEVAALVAGRIAALRRTHALSFAALAGRAGVAKGTLVQIEQGRANPSIATLCRLAAALQVSIADLVAAGGGPQPVTLVPAAAARRLWSGPHGGSAVLLAGTPGPDMLEIWDWTLMPGERFAAPAHGRGTRELLHVTEGALALDVAGEVTLVPAGAAALALTDRPHAYANPGRQVLRFAMTVHEPAAGA